MDSALIRRALALLLAPLVAACTSSPPRGAGAVTTTIALVGGRIQPDPNAAVIENGIVLTDGGTITAVGARSAVSVPTGAQVLDCAGATVLAGFWNSHVHFTRAAFRGAASAPPAQVTAALSAMLTSRGIVHAVDTGSYLRDTLALRGRIETGEIPGPSILTAGAGLAPAGGSPYYILPARLPEAGSAADAAAVVERELDEGSDV